MVEGQGVYKRYLAYKDSGVPWLGEIPEHWELKKLKHLFFEKKKISNPNLNCGAISFGQVVTKDDEKIPMATKASYQEVLKGEFLINPLNLNYDLISLRIALSNIDVVVSPGYIVLKNLVEINKSYFNWLLHRYDVAYMKLLGSGVRQTISFNHIANSILILPSNEEQIAIVNFLDAKTAKIDTAIAQKERLIELLRERRQIIIQTAVTKGLDPTVKFKDSGVECLGGIPIHWNRVAIKRVVNQQPNAMVDGPFGSSVNVSEDYADEGVPVVRTVNITEYGFNQENLRFMRKEKFDQLQRHAVYPGDVLFSKVGTIGNACVFPDYFDKGILSTTGSCKITVNPQIIFYIHL